MDARPTRNFLHPNMLLPVGTQLLSPTGIECRVAGRSELIPGRLMVDFRVNGKEFTHHIWPAKLRGFRTMCGSVLP